MKEKPNCYNCIYRGNIPGSAHSRCEHPAFVKFADDPLAQLASILGGFSVKSNECKVTANPIGIARGWFNHPFNFDPVWLESCTGYTPKETKGGENHEQTTN